VALEDAGNRLGGDRSVRRVKGQVDTRFGSDGGGELGGLEDSDVVWRGNGDVI